MVCLSEKGNVSVRASYSSEFHRSISNTVNIMASQLGGDSNDYSWSWNVSFAERVKFRKAKDGDEFDSETFESAGATWKLQISFHSGHKTYMRLYCIDTDDDLEVAFTLKLGDERRVSMKKFSNSKASKFLIFPKLTWRKDITIQFINNDALRNHMISNQQELRNLRVEMKEKKKELQEYKSQNKRLQRDCDSLKRDKRESRQSITLQQQQLQSLREQVTTFEIQAAQSARMRSISFVGIRELNTSHDDTADAMDDNDVTPGRVETDDDNTDNALYQKHETILRESKEAMDSLIDSLRTDDDDDEKELTADQLFRKYREDQGRIRKEKKRLNTNGLEEEHGLEEEQSRLEVE